MSYSSDSSSASICSMVGKLPASDSGSDSTSFVCHWEMPIGKPLGGQNKTSKKTQLPKASLGCWKGCVKLKSTNVKNGQFSHWGFAGVPNCSFLSGPARPSLRFMQTESQARDALKASLIRTWRYDQLKHKPSHENSLALPRTTNFYCQANWRNY